jgi:DNA-binding LytR/AlgR family response regulator
MDDKKIRCIVVDDERLARTLLENFISKIPQLELIEKCKSPIEAINCLRREPIDLMFLDIQMPDLTGIEFLRTVKRIKPLVIFTTAYSDFALEGYRLNITDYLLKPFSFKRFVESVEKAAEQIQLLRIANAIQEQKNSNAIPIMPTPSTTEIIKDYILIKAAHKIHKVKFEDIIYLQSMREYVAFHTKHERILALHSLKKLENELPADLFIRIHKSYTVPIHKVTSLEGNLICLNNEKLPIGSSYKDEVMLKIFGL